MSSDPASFLPPELVMMLKRKASRDLASRFPAKLRALLTYVTQNPQLEDEIGLAWIDDETFKMNKHALSAVMGIKLNTLNVNLRDLKFQQQQHNKDGWTRWKKEGFTRSSQSLGLEAISTFDTHAPVDPWGLPQPPLPRNPHVTIGKVSPQVAEKFFQTTDLFWRQLNGAPVPAVSTKTFTHHAGEKLRQEGQALNNAIEVLAAIISPTDSDMTTFDQFVKFMAMFGPRQTAMLKIESLLRCSHNTGQWLIFDTRVPHPPVFAAFDDREPNCLVITANKSVSRVWNMPLVESDSGQPYLVDSMDRTYMSWAEYFDENPVNMNSGYMDYPMMI